LVYEWNFAIERALWPNQSLSATYVGSHGTNLLREDDIQNNPSGSPKIYATNNPDWSNFSALQLQFRRRMSQGLQVLASYTLAKSLDTYSTDTCGCTVSDNLKNINVARDYGPSDFNQRHSFAAAISYEMIPSRKGTGIGRALLRGWALYGVLHISSALPFRIYTIVQSPVFGYKHDLTSYRAFRSTSQARSQVAAYLMSQPSPCLHLASKETWGETTSAAFRLTRPIWQ
jgi:hypothetical protein